MPFSDDYHDNRNFIVIIWISDHYIAMTDGIWMIILSDFDSMSI